MKILPETKAGKWSVGLQAFFLAGVLVSMLLVNVLGVLAYEDRWWDVTVPIIFLASIIAFQLGIRAIRKFKDTSILVRISVVVGVLTILFIFLHSLFIDD